MMGMFKRQTKPALDGFENREVVTIDRRSEQLFSLRVTDGVTSYEEELAFRVLSMDCEAGTVEMLFVRRVL